MNNITDYQIQEYPRSTFSLQENFLEKCSSLIRDVCILIGIIATIAFAIFSIISNYPIFGVGFFISSGFEIYLFMQMKKRDQSLLLRREVQQVEQANSEMKGHLNHFEDQITHFSSSLQNASETFRGHNENLGSHIQTLSAIIAHMPSRT